MRKTSKKFLGGVKSAMKRLGSFLSASLSDKGEEEWDSHRDDVHAMFESIAKRDDQNGQYPTTPYAKSVDHARNFKKSSPPRHVLQVPMQVPVNQLNFYPRDSSGSVVSPHTH